MKENGPPRKGEQRVPAAPFQQFLGEQAAIHGEAELALMVDRSVRWVFRYRNARQESKTGGRSSRTHIVRHLDTFPRSAVEDALDRFSPGLFYDMYPEYAGDQDITLEPDAWCPWCNQMVTPVDGLCPFCQCAHGHLFREVGVSDDGFACLACLAAEHIERAKTWPSVVASRKKAA
jgi:hypothetical protein